LKSIKLHKELTGAGGSPINTQKKKQRKTEIMPLNSRIGRPGKGSIELLGLNIVGSSGNK